MFDQHETHLHEREYIARVEKYLHSHYGKTLAELAISSEDVAKGLHDHLHPFEYVDNNAKLWGIRMRSGSIPNTAERIVKI